MNILTPEQRLERKRDIYTLLRDRAPQDLSPVEVLTYYGTPHQGHRGRRDQKHHRDPRQVLGEGSEVRRDQQRDSRPA